MSMKTFLVSLLAVTVLVGCADTRDNMLATEAGALQLRNIQSRAFDSSDKTKMLRAAIATLQDLGFVIDKADETLGSVSATKLQGYNLRMTISVRQKSPKQMIVRANAQYNSTTVSNPLPYQQFFDAYSKAVFLEAQAID